MKNEKRKIRIKNLYISGFFSGGITLILLALLRGFFDNYKNGNILWIWLMIGTFILFLIFFYYYLKELIREWKKNEV